MMRTVLLVAGLASGLVAAVATADAQPATSVSGYTSLMFDAVPGAPGTSTSADGAIELRARVFVDGRVLLNERLTLRAAAWTEGLAAERGGRRRREATLQPHEVSATWSTRAVELTAGIGQVVWGRLDEFQPTDLVNPIDITRFFLEGRSEARRAVGLVRARAFLPGGATLDGVYVPVFRGATFDMLGDVTSPFALAPREVCLPPAGCVPVVANAVRPTARAANGQGGARLAATSGRVDWALMAWRGFESVPLYVAPSSPSTTAQARPAFLPVDAVHPRTMVVGGDAETVRGAWGLRGELAWHVEDRLQAADRFAAIRARSLEGGVGVDRRAGDYRVSATVLGVVRSRRDGDPGAFDGRDLQLVASLDRNFARDTRRLRVFGVYNPGDRSAFVRGIGSWSLRDGWWLEASGGWLTGSAADTLSRLSDRDFVYLRARVYF